MSSTALNFCLDAFLFVEFITLMWVSLVLRMLFPQGIQAGGWRVLGFSYQAWFNLQFILICVLAAAILLHIMLHWSWVCGVVSKSIRNKKQATDRRTNNGKSSNKLDDGIRTLYGVGLLVAVVNIFGLAYVVALFHVSEPVQKTSPDVQKTSMHLHSTEGASLYCRHAADTQSCGTLNGNMQVSPRWGDII